MPCMCGSGHPGLHNCQTKDHTCGEKCQFFGFGNCAEKCNLPPGHGDEKQHICQALVCGFTILKFGLFPLL